MHVFDKINDEMWLTFLWSLWLMIPWRANFLTCKTMLDRQVPFGLVHMGRWLVRTSMGLKSPSNGCWDLISGRDRTMIDQAFTHEKKTDIPPKTLWLSPTQGVDPLQMERFPFDGQDVTQEAWTSSWACGSLMGWLARVATWRSPKRASIWLLDAGLAPKGPNVSLRGAWRLTFAYLCRLLSN